MRPFRSEGISSSQLQIYIESGTLIPGRLPQRIKPMQNVQGSSVVLRRDRNPVEQVKGVGG